MRDIIEQIYRININDIKEYKNHCVIKTDDNVLILKVISDENLLLKKYSLLTNKFHKIIPNKNNELISIINNQKYILMKVNKGNTLIDSPDILYTNTEVDWNISIWEKKTDSYREYLNLNIDINKKVIIYLNYFIGITENIITYYNTMVGGLVRNVLCHNKIDKNTYGINYYDPTNIVVDSISRELCDFAKAKEYSVKEVLNMFKYYNLSNDEINLFICRLLYPKNFFSWFDEYLNNRNIKGFEEVIEEENKNIIVYKELIKALKKSNYSIEEISWIL